MQIPTPCSTAEKCPENHLNEDWHDREPDDEHPGRIGHSEFVPHAEDWYRDPQSGKRTPDGRRRRRALERCWNECPMRIRLACLEIGLAQGPGNQLGIWGGHTEVQREQIVAARGWRDAGHSQQCITTALTAGTTVAEIHLHGGVADCTVSTEE